MSDSMRELRRILAQAVEASRLPRRQLERALGLGNGNLSRWLDGSLDIRLRHLLALARLLDVPPADFLELGFPERSQKAHHRLTDWLQGPPYRRDPEKELTPSAETLKELIRQVIREEEERRAGAAPEK